jgi:hypothetical protein
MNVSLLCALIKSENLICAVMNTDLERFVIISVLFYLKAKSTQPHRFSWQKSDILMHLVNAVHNTALNTVLNINRSRCEGIAQFEISVSCSVYGI